MQAIILAAGMGRRLKELTRNQTKCMVTVNGVPLIDRMLRQIEDQHLSRIIIVTGHQGEKLMEHIRSLHIQTPIRYIHNPVYDRTNNIYSLSLAKDFLCQEDTLLFESDLIVEDSIIQALVQDPRQTLALVDKYENWMDGTCVKLGKGDTIEAFIPSKKFRFEESESYYKTVNIYKFSKDFSRTHYVPFLEAYTKALGDNEYYEQVLRVIAMLDEPVIRAKRLEGQRWYEIDDIQDLDIATSIFTPNQEEKAALMQNRYGGYWRYPHLLDFSYLVNPYFPPQKLMDEIKANFERLLTQYPSGMRVNTLLAAKNFDLPQEYLAVGNGAAELIKELMGYLTGSTGLIRPTFEEYPNRYPQKDTIVFCPKAPAFRYTTQDLIDHFSGKNLKQLVLINPDNPSGNYLDHAQIDQLLDWSREMGIRLIVDESFIDFADEPDATLLRSDLLNANPHLIVVKSISKSYGVPGLRLGILASSDRQVVRHMKSHVAIWNINSFAEFYLQIAEKYQKEYQESLEKLRQERTRFSEELNRLKGIRVFPSQANYLMAEVTSGNSAGELTQNLLVHRNILIKDLSAKIGNSGQFLRLAIRGTDDNNQLIAALESELTKKI